MHADCPPDAFLPVATHCCSTSAAFVALGPTAEIDTHFFLAVVAQGAHAETDPTAFAVQLGPASAFEMSTTRILSEPSTAANIVALEPGER